MPEEAVPASPASGSRRLYVDSTTHDLTVLRSDGTTTDLETKNILTFFCLSGFGTGGTNASPAILVPGGGNTSCSGASFVEVPMPVGGTLKNLWVNVGAVGSTGTSGTTTVYVDNTATSITCTIGTGPAECSDVSHTATIAAGHLSSVRITGNQGAGESLSNMRVGLQLQ